MENGIEQGERLMRPDEVYKIYVASRILQSGELQARLDPDYSDPDHGSPLVFEEHGLQMVRVSQDVEGSADVDEPVGSTEDFTLKLLAEMREAAQAADVTKGAPELSRKAHAEAAIKSLRSFRFIKGVSVVAEFSLLRIHIANPCG